MESSNLQTKAEAKMENQQKIIKELRAGKNPPQFCGDREMVIVKYKQFDQKRYKYAIQSWTKREIEQSKIFLNFGGGVKLYEFVTPLYLTN